MSIPGALWVHVACKPISVPSVVVNHPVHRPMPPEHLSQVTNERNRLLVSCKVPAMHMLAGKHDVVPRVNPPVLPLQRML